MTSCGNRFSVIAPTYNAGKTCDRTILTLAAQSYDNWRLIVIDDVSTDDTESRVRDACSRYGVLSKLTYVRNETKKWEIENTLVGLSHCDSTDIVTRIDLDDYVIDNNAFEILDRVYLSDGGIDAVWTNHRWFGDRTGLTGTNISGPLPDDADPYVHSWVSSHMKTWRKRVSENVPDSNYRGSDGQYFRRIGDQAFYLPVLKLARRRGHLPITAYAYRCEQVAETFQTDDAKFQAEEAKFLRQRGFLNR